MSQPLGSPTPARSRAALCVTAIVYVVLAIRQQAFVARYAVDVMYWDNWDLYNPLFRGQGWWASFDYQHGPHRQGLGGWVMRVTAGLTRWDTRADAAAVSVTLILAAALGVWLAWRCGVRGLALVGVPVVYLSVRQYSTFIIASNPAHGAVPVLLFTGSGLAWFAGSTRVRLVLLVLLTDCLIFTGFGLFAGLVTPPLLAFEGVTALRSGDRRRAAALGAAVVGIALGWVAFAHGFQPNAASERFRFPTDRPTEYLYFIGVLFANTVGVGGVTKVADHGPGTIGLGLAVAAGVVAVALARGRRVWRAGAVAEPASTVIFSLALFGLIFAVDVSIGRTPEGWRNGASPRYVALCMPALLAILLHLGTSARPTARRAAVVCAGCLALGTTTMSEPDLEASAWLRDGCLRWRSAYLATHDDATATRLAHFLIYSRPGLNQKLDYMERRHLNLFDPTAFPTDVTEGPAEVTPAGPGL